MFSELSDAELERAYGNALADFALAQKYEHNAHLRPAIKLVLDELFAERADRAEKAERAARYEKACQGAAQSREDAPRSTKYPKTG